MRFAGVETGADFERFIIDGLLKAGLTVHDTPSSGDYGADLVFDYRGLRFVGQCKYYAKAVGLQAVQEIIGALGYYEAAYGIVFTNSTFTQQAKNLAASNRILLLDGEAIVNFAYDSQGIPAFDDFMNCTYYGAVAQVTPDWVMNDLVARYGISAQKIIKDCLSRGLPYYKVGREYRFDPHAVEKWEVRQRYIPVGHHDSLELPAFRALRLKLIHAYRDAKEQGDKAKISELKEVMRKHGLSVNSRWFSIFTNSMCIFVIALILIVIILYATGQIS